MSYDWAETCVTQESGIENVDAALGPGNPSVKLSCQQLLAGMIGDSCYTYCYNLLFILMECQ